ncbi:MAG: hypothetical protein HY983_03415 [Candidatus Magasanikbacteria bacterium]|nr:hypothetical protein [Candidatus Magasanikbacteria bacterium]
MVKKAKIKFDWHVDPLQLGAQFLRARRVKDYPKMLREIKIEEWCQFFEDEAGRLEPETMV